jgi:hypothetical protein
MNGHPVWRRIALALGVAFTSSSITSARAELAPCVTWPATFADPPSWIFHRSTYSHDPYTGARVAQYLRTPPVEPLEDERLVTSRYRRSRTRLRGIDGSVDTYYEVQAWGNGRGGIDAEWERFHDAWKESYLSGGFYNQGPGFAPSGYGSSYGGYPGFGFPGNGVASGFGFPHGNGYPPHGGWQGNHGHHGNGHHGHGGHHGKGDGKD